MQENDTNTVLAKRGAISQLVRMTGLSYRTVNKALADIKNGTHDANLDSFKRVQAAIAELNGPEPHLKTI